MPTLSLAHDEAECLTMLPTVLESHQVLIEDAVRRAAHSANEGHTVAIGRYDADRLRRSFAAIAEFVADLARNIE